MMNIPGICEKTLLLRVQGGDEKAKYLMYKQYVRYLAAVCSRYVGNDEDMKDVLQESFLKIFASIDNFEYQGEGSLKGWMSRIVLNESLKWLKHNSRLEFVELENEQLGKPETEPETDGLSDHDIYRMIRSLPDGYRTVFNLYVIEEKSHKEIARLLGITESTSASQLHRAKALLADMINQFRTRQWK